ncbi:MAG: helix-turn-helix domain-containing protein [Saprospiraceae bacterium]|nr:helix-turn-helix domain-containing protein [Saprospiraceae bacterium]
MPASILTTDDLREFKTELFTEIKTLISKSQTENVQQKKFLKSSDVADILGISPNTLYQMRVNRQLPFTKVNGIIFFDWDDIITMMSKNKKLEKVNQNNRKF